MSAFPDIHPPSPPPGWRKFFLFALLLILQLLISSKFPASALAQDFSIVTFHVDIDVRSDSSLQVRESIEVQFHRPRHGIYRDIPFKYVDEVGKKSLTPLSVISVVGSSGKSWKYRVRKKGGYLRVRIGNPRKYVNGHQIYIITYRVENGILFFPDHDELYWNVTGNDWYARIEKASASVTVAGIKSNATFRARCFTGHRGSREEACTISRVPEGTSFSSTRVFKPREGMTIVLGWPKGIVQPPSRIRQTLFTLNLRENWPFSLPVLTLIFMLNLWYRKGKDPRTLDPIVVEYAPPEVRGRTLLPVEAGALIDERLDPADITASVIDLAVKGHITIEEEKEKGLIFKKTDYLIRKINEDDSGLQHFEQLLKKRLFKGHGKSVRVSSLKHKFYKNIDDLKMDAFKGLKNNNFFTANPISVKSTYFRWGAAIFAFGLFFGPFLNKIMGYWSFRLPLSLAISGFTVIIFAPLMPVKTLKGVKMLGRVKGFEEFLTRAEKDRLERMKDEKLFEKYLPYAISLGVAQQWAEAFEEIYQKAPGWYISGDGPATFRPIGFHNSLDSALSTMSSAMVSAPRSSGSGFSGGGGSGGGGGGGGGGSW